jgi:hypothetical protein
MLLKISSSLQSHNHSIHQQIIGSNDLSKGVGGDILGARNLTGDTIEVLEEFLELTNIHPIIMN